MKNFLSSFQAQLAWILPSFVFITGYIVLNDIRQPVLIFATSVSAVLPFTAWVVSTNNFVKIIESTGKEIRRVPTFTGWFIYGTIFTLFIAWLPFACYTHINMGLEFPGDKMNMLFCSYSIGSSATITVSVFIARYIRARKSRLYREEIIETDDIGV